MGYTQPSSAWSRSDMSWWRSSSNLLVHVTESAEVHREDFRRWGRTAKIIFSAPAVFSVDHPKAVFRHLTSPEPNGLPKGSVFTELAAACFTSALLSRPRLHHVWSFSASHPVFLPIRIYTPDKQCWHVFCPQSVVFQVLQAKANIKARSSNLHQGNFNRLSLLHGLLGWKDTLSHR